ncbi:MDN1 [Symbiodinium microadriaticum]|nr:MDN1 [Symbiodinium microadriaticum]
MPASAAPCLAPDREVWEVSDDSDVEVLVVERLRPVASSELVVPEDVSSYVDKIPHDFDMFKKYVEGLEQQNAAAAGLVDRMKRHELFPRFCEEVGAEAGLWGQDQEQAATELSLFEEWLAEKEQSLVNAALVSGASAENQVAKALDLAANAETQVEYDEDVPLPDDLDGEALGEDEFPEAAVPRTLDDELERAATPAESSVLPAARCVEMDAILQGQQRRNDERERLVAQSAAVRAFRAGVAGESKYKYPMKVISEGMLAEVDAMNKESEPPRYGDQQCVRRGRKKAAEVDEDDDDKALDKMNADEVMLQMEEHCRRESVQQETKAKLATTRTKKKKEEVDKEPSDEENYEESQAEEEDEEEKDEPMVVKSRSKAKRATEEDEEDVPKRGKATGKAKKAKEDEEDVPRQGKGKKEEDEEDVPKRGKAKKEKDVPKGGRGKKAEDEEDWPTRGKAKKAEDEEDVPKRGSRGKKAEDEEDGPKRGKAKKAEDEEDGPKRGKAKKAEDEVPKRGRGKKVEDEEEMPKGCKAKRGTEDEQEVPKEGKGEERSGRVTWEEGAMVIDDDEDWGEAEEGPEMEAWDDEEKSADEEDVPKRGKGKKEEDEEDVPSRGKAKKEEDVPKRGKGKKAQDEEDVPRWGKAKKAEDEDDVPKRGKAKKAEDEEDVPKRGGRGKKAEDEEDGPRQGNAKKAEDEEDVPKRGKAKKAKQDEEDVPKGSKGRGKAKKAAEEDEEDVSKVSHGKRKQTKAEAAEGSNKKAKNSGGEDDSKGRPKELGLIVPPEHMQSNHIYSNAYRYSLALGHDLEEARNRARTAADEFRRSGRVPVDYVKGFRAPHKGGKKPADDGAKDPKPVKAKAAFIIDSDSETIAEDDDIMATPVRKKFMLHGLVCPNRRGLIDFGNDRWEDAQQPADIMSTASVDMSTPGQLSEEPRVPLKQKVDTFFKTWPGANVKPEGDHISILMLRCIHSFGLDDGHDENLGGSGSGWLLPAAPKGPVVAAANPSIPVNQAVNPSIPTNQAVNPSIPANQAVNPSIPANQAVNPSIPANQAVNPSIPINQAVNPSAPVKEALTPPKAGASPFMMVVNPSVPVKNEMALVRSPPPPRAAVSAVAMPKPDQPLVKCCAVPPPAACTTAVIPLQAKAKAIEAPPVQKMPALPAPAASAAKSAADPAKALVDQVHKKAKMATPPPKKAAPSNPPAKAAAVVSSPDVPDEQNVMKSVGKLHVMNNEMAIFPETYDERQSLYACFKRKLKKGDEVPDEFATLWVQACSSNSRSAKTALFHKWLTAGKDFARLLC